MNNALPVFIAGCGRSGTTFLRFVLSSNGEIFIPHESGFIIDYLKFGDTVPNHLLHKLLFKEPLLKIWYADEKFISPHIGKTIKKIHEAEALKHNCRIWGQKT